MEFNSQICTTEEQSERLLALGLKKETADMMLVRDFRYLLNEPYRVTIWDPQTISTHNNFQEFVDSMTTTFKGISKQFVNNGYKPAWSLHRLLAMLTYQVIYNGKKYEPVIAIDGMAYGDVCDKDPAVGWSGDLYTDVIDCIEWVISQEQFNPNYLKR